MRCSTGLPCLYRQNVTYITHSKSQQLHESNWKKKINSYQFHHIFYVTPPQLEIKSNTLHNTNTTCQNLLFNYNIYHVLRYTCTNRNRYRQYRSTLHLLNRKSFQEFTLEQPEILVDNIILHYTHKSDFHYIRTTWP